MSPTERIERGQFSAAVIAKMRNQLCDVIGGVKSSPPKGMSVDSIQKMLRDMNAQADALAVAYETLIFQFGKPPNDEQKFS